MAFVWTTFLVFLILGCVLPATPMIVLLVPLLYPIYTTVYGFDGIWLGVLLVVMMELAFITPPVGINLFVTKSLFGEEASWGDIWKGVAPFIIGDTIRLGIIVYIPLISLWLPQVMR
jgi:TRAP-type C4-dicarboxylate transport system permease large subunit